MVLGFNLITQKWKPCTVLKQFIRDYDYDSVFVTADGSTVESTFLHPYWVIEGEGACRNARPETTCRRCPREQRSRVRGSTQAILQVGDVLLLRDGRQVPIESIRLEHRQLRRSTISQSIICIATPLVPNKSSSTTRINSRECCSKERSSAKSVRYPGYGQEDRERAQGIPRRSYIHERWTGREDKVLPKTRLLPMVHPIHLQGIRRKPVYQGRKSGH